MEETCVEGQIKNAKIDHSAVRIALLTMRKACWLMRACCVAAICIGSATGGEAMET